MKIINTPEAMACVLASSLDPHLKHLLQQRIEQLGGYEGYDPYDLVTFVIIEPLDRVAEIETALGLPITTNLVDGSTFGEPDFEPSSEYIARHPGWFELVYVLRDDGAGIIIWIPDDDDIDADLLSLCRIHAQADANAMTDRGDTD
jgi:hypothetical protein